ncbi:DNA binding domain, excisionase family [Shimia thalassica]|uniref:DNA binding domain, excisionase family n=1 Tax=Shimia thalassica TaxID=1715693 RepID=A0A0N7M866_9RHOB|nr:helix-turn-helix domain-containing protein [Shimia thalassica]CUJ84176.1 DNA binding domain, excisionase family [Shimia thalassica]
MAEEKVFMSPTAFAEAMGVSSVTVHRWIKARTLKAVQRGKVVLIPRSEVGRFAKEADDSIGATE